MKLVLDTNVWLDLLVFDDPLARRLRGPELERVLAYPLGKWSLAPQRRAACLGECRRIARRIEPARAAEGLPRCQDPDDQKFVELAAAAGADALVTRDAALLRLRGRVPFRIARPAEL